VSPLEFTEDGRVYGPFGDGTYELASEHSILIDCRDEELCEYYLGVFQDAGEPLLLSVWDVSSSELALLGFGYDDPWTLEKVEGSFRSYDDIVGLWQYADEDDGYTLEFLETGECVLGGMYLGS
jgi:hypothetical protein